MCEIYKWMAVFVEWAVALVFPQQCILGQSVCFTEATSPINKAVEEICEEVLCPELNNVWPRNPISWRPLENNSEV